MKPDAAFQRRVMRVFEDMLDQSPEDRAAWLDDACRGEPAVRDAVREMDRASRSSGFLPTLPPEPGQPGVEERWPERIGQYRITSELGRGGMGIVYLGERDDGLFEHKVAIKLIRRTVFSQRALDQFAIERRILARLRHPHITQILDGGVTTDGHSYIVMERIAGVPITDYCADSAIDLAGRLSLFREAALAVEHAHRNLIVHSDIKPNNVIVEEGFGVKLLDFGVARLLDESESPDHGAYTPGHASPERVAGAMATPADDIFAAGILLGQLIEDVPGVDADLDAVRQRATADDPDERYGTIGDLVTDIDRWTSFKPIRTAKPTRRRTAYLFWRRHRIGVAVTATIIGVVLAALALSTAAWLQASRARSLAERRYGEARAMSRYLIDDVTGEIAPLPGSSAVRERIAIRAEHGLERLGGAAGTETQMGLDDALASVEVGEILGADGREGLDPAIPTIALRRAEVGLPPLIAQHPDRPDLPVLLARAYVADAWLGSHVRNDPAAAFRLVDRADAMLLRPAVRNAGPAASRNIRWDAALARAYVVNEHGDDDRSNISLLEGTLRWAAAPAVPRAASEALRLSRTLNYLGDANWYAGDKELGLTRYRAALAALGASALDRDTRIVQRRAFEQYQIASTLADLGRKQAALEHSGSGLSDAVRLRTFDDTPPVQHIVNVLQNEYGSELTAVGRYDEGIAQMRASIASAAALARSQPLNYYDQREVPISLRPLGEVYLRAGRKPEACMVIDAALADWKQLGSKWRLGRYDGQHEEVLLKTLRTRCSV